MGGRIDRARLDAEQHVVHGLAWYATYAELFRQLAAWSDRLAAESRWGEAEETLCGLLAAEYGALAAAAKACRLASIRS